MLKSTFSGLQCSVADSTVNISWMLLPPKSSNPSEILRTFELIAVQRHPRSTIPMVNMQLSTIVIINSNFGSISCTVFEILTHLGSVE